MLKKIVFLVVLLGLILNFCYSHPVFAEDITITTYYPSPHGSYDELGANKLAVDIAGVAVPAEYAAMQNGDAHIGRSLIIGSNASGYSYNGGATTADGTLLVKGNTGIGTTAPTSKLVVQGTGATNATSSLNVTNSVGTSSLHVRDDGFVGVGGPTGGALWDKLHVRGIESTPDGLNAAIALQNSAPGGDTWHFRAGATGTNTPAGGLSIANAAGYAVSIDSNRNVGIGTTTPLTPLQIKGKSGAINYPSGVYITDNPLWLRDNGGSILFGPYLGGGTNQATAVIAAGWQSALNPSIEMRVTRDSHTTGIKADYTGWVTADGNVRLSTGYLDIRNPHQDKIWFGGNTNGQPNRILYDNSAGVGIWDGAASRDTVIFRPNAWFGGALQMNATRTLITGFDGANNHWINAGNLWDPNRNALAFNPVKRWLEAGPGWGFHNYGSARKYKRDIKQTKYGLAEVLKLKPVNFILKNDPDNHVHLGFIAEEVDPIIPEVVARVDNKPEGLNYEEFIPVLTNAIKEQQKQIDNLEVQIKELKKKIK